MRNEELARLLGEAMMDIGLLELVVARLAVNQARHSDSPAAWLRDFSARIDDDLTMAPRPPNELLANAREHSRRKLDRLIRTIESGLAPTARSGDP